MGHAGVEMQMRKSRTLTVGYSGILWRIRRDPSSRPSCTVNPGFPLGSGNWSCFGETRDRRILYSCQEYWVARELHQGIQVSLVGGACDIKDAAMAIPLKVVDRGGLLTGKLAEHVRERAQKLSHFGRVKECRVTVDGPGQHDLRGRIRVRIYLSLPDSEIAVNRQAAEDLPIAIRGSFDAADRRLE